MDDPFTVTPMLAAIALISHDGQTCRKALPSWKMVINTVQAHSTLTCAGLALAQISSARYALTKNEYFSAHDRQVEDGHAHGHEHEDKDGVHEEEHGRARRWKRISIGLPQRRSYSPDIPEDLATAIFHEANTRTRTWKYMRSA